MNDTVLRITDLGTNGDGVARLDSGEVVFVPLSVTGDVVEAQVSHDHDGIARGKVTKIVEPSMHRAEPPCRHFGICGGCSLQHLDSETYRDFKIKTISDALSKSGVHYEGLIDAVFIPPHTRRRANFAARVVKGRAIIGFHERKSGTIRDVPDCLLINDNVREVMEGFRPLVPQLIGEGQKIDILIQCVDGNREIALTGKLGSGWEVQQALSDALRTLGLARISIRAKDFENYKLLLEEKPYYVRFGELDVNLAPGAFLQPSDEGQRELTDRVMKGVGDASRAADLFCGNGTFTGPLMAGRDIIAADFAPDAVSMLGRAGVKAFNRNLFKDPLSKAELWDRDVVVIDPPRAGASAQVRELADSDVPTVVYVSCNPQTFAKDAAKLQEGGYSLTLLTMVDQFVWSSHLEVVGIFRKTLT